MTDLATILAEIDELAGVPLMQDNDVTVEMLQEMWHGIGDTSAADRMKPLVAAGQFETLRVYDPAIGRIRRVWRKRQSGGSAASEGEGGGVD